MAVYYCSNTSAVRMYADLPTAGAKATWVQSNSNAAASHLRLERATQTGIPLRFRDSRCRFFGSLP
jgi:hypothetical protein